MIYLKIIWLEQILWEKISSEENKVAYLVLCITSCPIKILLEKSSGTQFLLIEKVRNAYYTLPDENVC